MQVHAKTCVQTRELSSRFVGRAAQCWPSATSPAMPANSRHLLPLLLLLSCRRLFTARSGAALLYVLSMSCGVWLCINLILEAARSVLASRNRSVFCRCFTISIVIQHFKNFFFGSLKLFFLWNILLFCFVFFIVNSNFLGVSTLLNVILLMHLNLRLFDSFFSCLKFWKLYYWILNIFSSLFCEMYFVQSKTTSFRSEMLVCWNVLN